MVLQYTCRAAQNIAFTPILQEIISHSTPLLLKSSIPNPAKAVGIVLPCSGEVLGHPARDGVAGILARTHKQREPTE